MGSSQLIHHCALLVSPFKTQWRQQLLPEEKTKQLLGGRGRDEWRGNTPLTIAGKETDSTGGTKPQIIN